MRFAILSTLALVGAAVASTEMQNVKREQACVGDLLCCGELKTPLDPAVDPILLELDINATSIVGSIGLDCSAYAKDSCDNGPKCCTEANLLGGLVALGCAPYEG